MQSLERLAVSIGTAVGLSSVVSQRLYRYLVMGVPVAVVYVAAMMFVSDVLGAPAAIGSIAAFVSGGVVSYIGNTLWGFSSQISRRTGGRFAAVILLTFVLTIVVAAVMEHLRFNSFSIGVFTAVMGAGVNFVGHNLFTYNK